MRIITHALLALLFTISCKKKDSHTPAPTNNNNNITTNYTYGSMSTIYYQYYNSNTFSGSDSSVSAFFFTDPLNPSNTTVNAGTISFNDSILNSSANLYSAYYLNIHKTNSVWKVSGSIDVPVINYTLTPNYPVFTGNNQLPDSFSKSHPLTFQLSGISNHDNASIYVQIHDNMNSVYKVLNANQFTCSFTASELSVLQANSYAYIMVNLGNTIIQTVGGKSYAFGFELNHMKSGVLIKP